MCRHARAQGVSQDELMVDAQQELLRAAERFDASRGARLTTYAWHNIMNRLTLVPPSPPDLFSWLGRWSLASFSGLPSRLACSWRLPLA